LQEWMRMMAQEGRGGGAGGGAGDDDLFNMLMALGNIASTISTWCSLLTSVYKLLTGSGGGVDAKLVRRFKKIDDGGYTEKDKTQVLKQLMLYVQHSQSNAKKVRFRTDGASKTLYTCLTDDSTEQQKEYALGTIAAYYTHDSIAHSSDSIARRPDRAELLLSLASGNGTEKQKEYALVVLCFEYLDEQGFEWLWESPEAPGLLISEYLPTLVPHLRSSGRSRMLTLATNSIEHMTTPCGHTDRQGSRKVCFTSEIHAAGAVPALLGLLHRWWIPQEITRNVVATLKNMTGDVRNPTDKTVAMELAAMGAIPILETYVSRITTTDADVYDPGRADVVLVLRSIYAVRGEVESVYIPQLVSRVKSGTTKQKLWAMTGLRSYDRHLLSVARKEGVIPALLALLQGLSFMNDALKKEALSTLNWMVTNMDSDSIVAREIVEAGGVPLIERYTKSGPERYPKLGSTYIRANLLLKHINDRLDPAGGLRPSRSPARRRPAP